MPGSNSRVWDKKGIRTIYNNNSDMIIWNKKHNVVTTYEREYLNNSLLETDISLRNQMYRDWGIRPVIKVIINDTLARSLEPVVTECKEHTIHTQTQIVASRKPKEIKHTHEGEANFT